MPLNDSDQPDIASAVRQIVEDDGAKITAKFNKSYAIALHGGKTHVVKWTFDSEAAENIEKQWRLKSALYRPDFVSPYEIRKLHLPERRVIAMPGEQIARSNLDFDYWLSSPNASRFHRVEYKPGAEPVFDDHGERTLNLWRGWPYDVRALLDAASGGRFPETPYLDEFLFEIIANGDEKLLDYVLDWIAYTYQKPAEPIGVMLVMQGLQGVGKGSLARLWGAPWGANFFPASGAEDVFGRFTSHLLNKSAIFIDEGFWAGDARALGRLNAMITEPSFSIEGKGVQTVTVRNTLKIMLASNADWVVPAGTDSRRFQVFEPSNRWKEKQAKWDALRDELAAGAQAKFFLDSLRRDIGGFRPQRDRITTDATRRQARATHGAFVEFLAEFVSARPFGCFERDGVLHVPKAQLLEQFRRFAEDRKVRGDFTYNPTLAIEGEIKRIIGAGHDEAHRMKYPEALRSKAPYGGEPPFPFDGQWRAQCYAWPTWRQIEGDVLRAKFGIECERDDSGDWIS